ncbi:ADP/ATP translocase 2 domain protein [Necator americanus]|uniref:ADP/ATP translocase n=1 Tax=Necator americanus TaxID=51031 RepID=W2TTU3_NECAM|nr:ADP/ATP translocase 2 domain protein [Necator americanus]ETN84472.1 ADP/ATP translocase 2 domain protein [Necator americanus]
MEVASTSTADAVDVMKKCLAGGTAAAFSKTTTAPIDRVKLLLQLQNHGRAAAMQYNGMRDCLRKVSIEQGILSLWRGNGAGVLRCFPNQALNFALLDFYKNLLMTGIDRKGEFAQFVLGKCYLIAVDVNVDGSKKYKGMLDCLDMMRKREGYASWYRGFSASVQFVFASRAAFFGAFDVLRTSVADPKQLHFLTTWMLAQCCLITSGLLCYPLDTVRRQMMMQAGKLEKSYRNSLSCFCHIAKTSGRRGFYRGAMTNSLRSTGGAMVVSCYYEFAKYL